MKLYRKILEALAENGPLQTEDFPDYGRASQTIKRRLIALHKQGKVYRFHGRGRGRPVYWSLTPRTGQEPPPTGCPPCMTQEEYALWRSGAKRALVVACRDCTPEHSKKMHAAGKCPVYHRITFRADRDGFIAGYFQEEKNAI